MASLAFLRRMPQLAFLAIFAFLVALNSGLAGAARPPVRFITGEDVHYGDVFYILSANWSEGGVTSEGTIANRRFFQHLTGSSTEPGSQFRLESASCEQPGSIVRALDMVYVDFVKLTMDLPEYWTWRKRGERFFLVRAFGRGRKFMIVPEPFTPLIFPPVYHYRLISCAGINCGGLSRYAEDNVTYITLDKTSIFGDLVVQFTKRPTGFPQISLPTDN